MFPFDKNISKTQKDFEHVKQKAADLLLALTKAETSIADLQEEISENEQAHLDKLAVVKGQVAFLTNARKLEGKAWKEAEKTIAVLEAEISSLLSKIEIQKNLTEFVREEYKQKTNDFQILAEKFLKQIQAMERDERNKAMRENKFDDYAIGKTGLCLGWLRNDATLSDDCKSILVDIVRRSIK